MPEFDAVAYAATEKLFNTAYQTLRDLPGLIEEYNAQYALHSGITDVVGKAALTDGQDALVDNLAKHSELLAEIQADMETLNEAVEDAHKVLDGLTDAIDVSIMRLRYLCGMSERDITRLEVDGMKVWQYSENYIYERKAIAILHASAVVRALGLVSKYS